ncbi:MAG: DUF1569 domain-containing protein [Granulicella sp.]
MQALLEQLEREINASLHGLNAVQTQLRPAGDSARWSIQQITEHLLLTYTSTASLFEARIAKGTPTRTQPTLLQRSSQWAVCKFGYFPQGRKSPAAVAPPESSIPASGEMLATEAHDSLTRLDTLTQTMEPLFGTKRSAVHHVLGPLNSQQWLRFHLVHGQHHLRQILAIRAEYGV